MGPGVLAVLIELSFSLLDCTVMATSEPKQDRYLVAQIPHIFTSYCDTYRIALAVFYRQGNRAKTCVNKDLCASSVKTQTENQDNAHLCCMCCSVNQCWQYVQTDQSQTDQRNRKEQGR